MYATGRKLKLTLAAAALLVGLILWAPAVRLVFAVQMALSLQQLSSGKTREGLSALETAARRQDQGRTYEALIYRPLKATPKTAVILVAGLSELGCHHPRLIALSRLLAEKGLMVITPDIREFRQFQITAEPIREVLFWYRQVPMLEGGDSIRQTGLAGISFSGTLALMAAARQEIRDRVGFVAAIGPYSDLMRCTQGWFSGGPEFVAREYYPTRFYAKWIVMLAALEMIPDSDDQVFLRSVLNSLLLQKAIPSPDPIRSVEGKRWYELATIREDRQTPPLAGEIQQYLTSRIYPQLNPAEELGKIRCPVFLVHGAYDDLIPAQESVELHSKISKSRLLLSPFLTHTHPTDTPLSRGQKLQAAFDTVCYCYHLARVMRP